MGQTSNGQEVHRPGPLKQRNKPHKGGKSKKNHNGRVNIKTARHNISQELNRKDRKHKANQIRKNKRDALLDKKRGIGTTNVPPVLVAIIALEECINGCELLEKLKTCDTEINTCVDELGHCHINFPKQKKRFVFFIPKYDNMHAVMDAVKVSDAIVFIHSTGTLDGYGEMLLSVILAHGLPTSFHVLPGLSEFHAKKKSEIKKLVLKKLSTRFPDGKLFHADTQQELQLLLRQIGCQKRVPVPFKDNRSHLIAEKVEFSCDNDSDVGRLMVSGYVRCQPLNVNGLLHIPDWGDFQMSQIVYEEDPYPLVRKKKGKGETDEFAFNECVVISDRCDPALQESLQSELIPNIADSQELLTAEDMPVEEKREVDHIKVAEGTSDYQAAWILESSDEASDEEDDENDFKLVAEMEDDSLPQVDDKIDEEENDNFIDTEQINEDNYDKQMDMNEENQMLVRFREERMEEMFPDERDTPGDVTARLRYQKYRGLKNFADAPWDPLQDLPVDYSRIYCFENFKLTKKKILSTDKEGCLPGSYVTLHIMNVPKSLYDGMCDNVPFIVYGMLPHEQKMSVVNIAIKKHLLCNVPIKSKDKLIFHVGFRRFTCRPILSQHTIGNKFKYEVFLPKHNVTVASFYAPTMFPSAPVVVFRQKPSGEHELVATGSLLNVEPNRVIVKRVVLSGHPFKINQRSAVIRFMFFNNDDINWFKRIELRTKCGFKGHIKESLGSHGHVKCVFDRQLPSQDVVFMCLYKRVFPKWTFDPQVPMPISPYSKNKPSIEDMLF